MLILSDGRFLLKDSVEQANGSYNIFNEKRSLTESIDRTDGAIRFKCIIQRADAQNRNGRVYPYQVLDTAINRYQEKIEEKCSYGELDHPDTLSVALGPATHIIEKTWWEGKDLYGQVKLITSTGYKNTGVCSLPGDKIAEFLSPRHNLNIGISSRGVGSVKKIKGYNYVDNDYDLICFDLVATPSVHGAFLLPVKEEDSKLQTEELKFSQITDKQRQILEKILKK